MYSERFSKQTLFLAAFLGFGMLLVSPFLYRALFKEANQMLFTDFNSIKREVKSVILTAISLLTGTKLIYIIVIFFYNYYSLAESVNILVNIYVTKVFSNFLTPIYRDPRPYLEDLGISPYKCVSGWGSPAYKTCLLTVFFLGIRKLVVERKNYENNFAFKIVFSAGIYIYVLSICFFTIFLGVNSLEQNVFGMSFGFFIHFLVFRVAGVPKHHPTLVLFLIKTPAFAFSIFFFGCYIVNYLIYIYASGPIKTQWEITALQECSADIRCHIQNFDIEPLFNYYSILPFFGLIFALKADFALNFDYSAELYVNYYFDEPEKNDDDSLFFKESRWNTCTKGKNLLRFVIIGLISALPLSTSLIIVDCKLSNHIYYFLTLFLPEFSFFFCLFFFSQKASQFMSLSNDKTMTEFLF